MLHIQQAQTHRSTMSLVGIRDMLRAVDVQIGMQVLL